MDDQGWAQDALQQKKLKHRLETQSWHIERVFARHQVPAEIIGGTVRPSLTRFDLRAQLETGLERLREAALEIRQVLGVPEVSVNGQDGRYRLRLVSAEEPPVSLLRLMDLVPEWPGITTALGMTDKGEPLLMDFMDGNTAHMLISGDRDSGKTALLRTMALSMSLVYRQSQLQLFVIADCEHEKAGVLLQPLELLPHMLAPVGRHLSEATDFLEFLVDEVSYRQQHNIVMPAIVLMIDEVVGLVELGGSSMIELITRLAQHGAPAGIHLVMTTKYPDSTLLDELLKANLPVRLAGRVADDRLAGAALGIREPSVRYLSGRGEFLAVIDGSSPRQFQAAFADDYDLHLCLDEMQRRRPRPILAQRLRIRDLIYGDMTAKPPDAAQSTRFVYDGRDVAMPSDLADSYDFLDDEAVEDEAFFEEE